jgi:aminopeptidase N
MKHLLIILLLIFQSALIAQTNQSKCNYKRFTGHKTKSNTLPLSYIQETEKYDVTHYSLAITANNMNTNLSGEVQMTATALTDLDSVILELFPSYTINYILFNTDTAKYNWRNTGIHCKVNLKKGESFTITTNYAGKAPDQKTNPLGGSGYSQKQSPSWKKNVSWTLSEPFSAYEWFPCKQSLKDKIDSVQVAITVPDSCMAGSNGILQKVIQLPNNQKCYTWKHLQPIDYYLISFSVANYTDYTIYAHPKNADSIPIQNFVYPNALSTFQPTINNTAKFIDYFSEIYTLYPFHKEKYGHCMAPISGGMEHQTMTTLGYFDNELIAHELAHQWWGDNVTCGSWADIWLNEGFATYSEYLMLAKLFPGDEKTKLEDIHSSVLSVSTGSTWVKDSLNENSIFSRELVYDKGAAIIHTLRYIINNDSIFFKALQNYQTTYAYNTATALNFKKSIENTTGLDLTNFFNEWYYGEGYPTYAGKITQKTDNLTEVIISHTCSAPNKTNLFTNPIDVKIGRTNKADTIIRFNIGSNYAKFEFPATLNLSEIKDMDPSNYIVNRVAQFTNKIDTMKDNVLFYPNPTQDFISIELKNAMNASVKICAMDGKIIFEKTFTKETQVDLRNQTAGNYLLIIEGNNTIYEHKITKN